MEDFNVLKVSFRPEDFMETMEDKFFTAKIIQSCSKIENKDELRLIIEKLAQLASQRQGLVRGLCMKLARLESEQAFNIDKYSDFINEMSDKNQQ